MLRITVLTIFVLFAAAFAQIKLPPNPGKETASETKNVGVKNNILPEPPEAVGGTLTEEKYKEMPNREVTEDNLQEFITAFRAAKGSEKQNVVTQKKEEEKETAKKRSAKQITPKRLKNEKAVETVSGDPESGVFNIPDEQGGNITFEWTYNWTEKESSKFYELTETATERYKSFDYSKSQKLFFGGVVCLSSYEYEYDSETERIEILEGKASGKIEFRGEFAGSVEYIFPYYREAQKESVYENNKYKGEIIISSGAKKIKLSVDDWWDFWYLVE